METKGVEELVRLRRRQAELEAEAEGIKERADQLQEQVVEEFLQAGITQIKLDGGTAYLHRQLWASAAEGGMEDLCRALYAEDMGHFVRETVNSQTLSAWVRELDREGEPLPAAVAACTSVVEKVSVRVRRS